MAEGPHGASPGLATLLTSAGFFALLVAGFGMLSLLTDAEVLPVAGLGQAAGIVGVAAAVLTYAVAVRRAVRRPRASYPAIAVVAAVTFLAYLAGVLAGALLAGVDPARAVAGVGGFATSWFAVVLASAAVLSGWVAVALVRTRASPPRWPWERGEREAP